MTSCWSSLQASDIGKGAYRFCHWQFVSSDRIGNVTWHFAKIIYYICISNNYPFRKKIKKEKKIANMLSCFFFFYAEIMFLVIFYSFGKYLLYPVFLYISRLFAIAFVVHLCPQAINSDCYTCSCM